MITLDVSIDRSCADMDDRALTRLCRDVRFHSDYAAVTHLYLWDNRIADAGMAQLARCAPHLPALAHVWLGHNLLGDRGVRAFCGAEWPALARLVLDDNAIGDAGAAALADAALPRLERLGLHTNRVGDAGAERLLELPLRVLWLSFNPLSDRAKRAVRRAGHPVR